jgi:hypothetical protein
MEVSKDKKGIQISLDISPLFFHLASKLVQALVITYDKQPFLDLGFDGVVRWKLPASEMFFQFPKYVKVQWGQVGTGRWVGVGSRNGCDSRTSPTARAWKISCYDKCLNKFGKYVEK